MEQVWNQRNDQFVKDHLANPCRLDGLPPECQSPAGFIQFRDGLVGAIPDLHLETLECIQEGRTAMGHFRVTGHHKRTNEEIDFTFACSVVIKDNKIVEARNVVDFLTMMVQTKAISPELLAVNLQP